MQKQLGNDKVKLILFENRINVYDFLFFALIRFFLYFNLKKIKDTIRLFTNKPQNLRAIIIFPTTLKINEIIFLSICFLGFLPGSYRIRNRILFFQETRRYRYNIISKSNSRNLSIYLFFAATSSTHK